MGSTSLLFPEPRTPFPRKWGSPLLNISLLSPAPGGFPAWRWPGRHGIWCHRTGWRAAHDITGGKCVGYHQMWQSESGHCQA